MKDMERSINCDSGGDKSRYKCMGRLVPTWICPKRDAKAQARCVENYEAKNGLTTEHPNRDGFNKTYGSMYSSMNMDRTKVNEKAIVLYSSLNMFRKLAMSMSMVFMKNNPAA